MRGDGLGRQIKGTNAFSHLNVENSRGEVLPASEKGVSGGELGESGRALKIKVPVPTESCRGDPGRKGGKKERTRKFICMQWLQSRKSSLSQKRQKRIPGLNKEERHVWY